MRIGVVDSGIGGLSVLKTLINKYPKNEYIYLGDTLNMPYGEKDKEEIITLGNSVIRYLESLKVDVIVLACGTLSSQKEYLTSKVPLIDVLSPLNNKLNNYENVAIMATPLSIKTNAFAKYIKTNLNLIACPLLATVIEKGNGEEIRAVVKHYVAKAKKSDVLVLGCTHYPIVRNLIEEYYPKRIVTLDEYLVDFFENCPESENSLLLEFTNINDKLKEQVKDILEKEDLNIKKVVI